MPWKRSTEVKSRQHRETDSPGERNTHFGPIGDESMDSTGYWAYFDPDTAQVTEKDLLRVHFSQALLWDGIRKAQKGLDLRIKDA